MTFLVSEEIQKRLRRKSEETSNTHEEVLIGLKKMYLADKESELNVFLHEHKCRNRNKTEFE